MRPCSLYQRYEGIHCFHLQDKIFLKSQAGSSSITFGPIYQTSEPRSRSRYSDWLRAGRPRGRSSSPGRVKDFVQSGSEVHPTSYPMGTGGSFPGGEAAGAWSWLLSSSWCRGQENVDLYINSPYTFIAWCLIRRAHGQLYLYLCLPNFTAHSPEYRNLYNHNREVIRSHLLHIVSYYHDIGVCDYRRGMYWWMDLLTTYAHDSELQVNTALSVISTIHKPQQNPLSFFPACCVFISRCLVTSLNDGHSSTSVVTPLPDG
jgi:hypothetical protein